MSNDLPQPTIDSEVDKFLTKFYEDSVDAYHAFMGTYTDAVADNEAPDRLIDTAAHTITNLIAQEANKARLIKPGEVIPYTTIKGKDYVELSWLTDRLTADKEQA